MYIYIYIYYRLAAYLQKCHPNNYDDWHPRSMIIWLLIIQYGIIVYTIRYFFSDSFNTSYPILKTIVIFVILYWVVTKYFKRHTFEELHKRWGNDSSREKIIKGGLSILYIAFNFFLLIFISKSL